VATERARGPRGNGPGSSGARRLVVLVRPDDARGFRLAGARVETAQPGEEPALLRTLLAEPTLGVLAIEEEVLAHVPPRLLRRVRERGVPVLLPFALPRKLGEEGKGREYVAALIRRAIGYAVRLAGPGGGRGR
jgi:V/A-type H+-transporting ATPase subunit F